MKLSYKRLLNIFFPVIIILTIVIGVFSYNNNRTFNDTSRWVKHSYTVLDKSDNIYALTMQIESGSNSYLFTHDTNSLIQFQNASSQIGKALSAFKLLAHDMPNQQQNADSLTSLINEQVSFTNQYIQLEKEKQFNTYEQLNYVRQNRFYSSRINALLSRILNNENAILHQREDANNRSIYIFHWVFYSMLVCLLTLLIGVIWLIVHIFQRQENEKQIMNRALAKEKELSEMKSRFVSFASHEFRTPLATILSSTALIERYQDGKLDDMSKKHINRVKSNVKNLIDLLNDFLSLGKLEEGKIDNNPQEINAEEFADEIITSLKELAKPGQQIIYKTEGTPEPIYVDEKLLRNVLNNLLSNAIKYSPLTSEIDFNIIFNNNHVSFVVKDHGIGIPEKDQKHLFETFFRASNATQTPGTGLGLCIVKRYIDIMGGSLKFKSKENEGTTFEVQIPKMQAQ